MTEFCLLRIHQVVAVFLMLLGLFRMFFPKLQLEASKYASTVIVEIMPILAAGIFLTLKAYSR